MTTEIQDLKIHVQKLENELNEIKIRLKWFADAVIEANISENVTNEARGIKTRL